VLDFFNFSHYRKPTPVRVVFLASAALLITTAISAAEVYRSIDADGTVRYSDRPDGENVETIVIATPRPSSTPPAVQPSAAEPPPEVASEPTDPEQREPTRRELAAERAANCSAARERNDRYQMSRRLYRSTGDGEREYLSDAEIDAARAGAADDVEKWCN
jgi:type IV secretory pathway VirB10-like protein